MIQLRCAHPAVGAAVQRWIEESRLDPPSDVILEIEVTDRIAPVADPRTPFVQPSVEIFAGPPSDDVMVRWTGAPALATIAAGTRTARVALSPAAAKHIDDALRTFLLNVLILLLRRVGWHHVHAAALIDPEGHGWLLAGNTHAGKSTTAAALAADGWSVACDDIAFLAVTDGEVVAHGCRSRIALREGGYGMLGRRGGTPLPERGKRGFWPEELGGRWIPEVRPERILFTTVGQDVTSATPLPIHAALAALVRWSAWVVLEPAMAQDHLDMLARLARQARSYRVQLGADFLRNPRRLADLAA